MIPTTYQMGSNDVQAMGKACSLDVQLRQHGGPSSKDYSKEHNYSHQHRDDRKPLLAHGNWIDVTVSCSGGCCYCPVQGDQIGMAGGCRVIVKCVVSYKLNKNISPFTPG